MSILLCNACRSPSSVRARLLRKSPLILEMRSSSGSKSGRGKTYTDEARITELERMVSRLTMENDLLKKALQRLNNKG